MKIDYQQYLQRVLPYRKRTPMRKLWLSVPLNALQRLHTAYEAWCSDIYYRINANAQIMVLQYTLNRNVSGSQGLICVKHYEDEGLFVQLSTEDPEVHYVGEGSFVALIGEISNPLDCDFFVTAPSTVNRVELYNELERYRVAGKSYEIVIQ